MKKLLAILVAIAMTCSLSIMVFAETELYKLETRASDTTDPIDGFTISGWCPSLITQYMFSDVMASFLEAIETEGAKIEVVSSGEVNGILLQSYPLENGSGYPHIVYTEKESSEADGRVVTVFDCAGFIELYTSTDHSDDPSVKLSMDNVLNFAVDASEGTVLYGVRVYTDSASAEPETAEPETAEPETTSEPETTPEPETTAPAETGIALALIPMAIAAAGVVISKRR